MYSQTLSISFPLYQNVFIPRLSCSSFFFKAILMMNVETVQPSPSAKVKSPASIEVVWFVCHQQRETWHVCVLDLEPIQSGLPYGDDDGVSRADAIIQQRRDRKAEEQELRLRELEAARQQHRMDQQRLAAKISGVS